MADKLTPLIVDALSRAAAEPDGVPLFGTKSEPGLFPASAAGKPAAEKAIADGFLKIVGRETKGKQTRELAASTEAGLRYLVDEMSPKQVLEDFVRVLEKREGEVCELVAAANRMVDSLAGLKAAVAIVLPRVEMARIPVPATIRESEPSYTARESFPETDTGGVAVCAKPVVVRKAVADDLADVIIARLADWSGSATAGQDCPLPELFRGLGFRENPPTLGAFHDCLRTLLAEGRIYLHPWTGPLYALPEPMYALISGHNVAYYASLKQRM